MRKTFAFLAFLIVILFIWGQSTLPPQVSSAESGWIFRLLRPYLDFLFGFGNFSHAMIRKMAHYMEYGVLGFLTMYVVAKDNRKRFGQFFLSLAICALVAFLDETLQIFTGRGPAILDVWVDLSGAFVGLLVWLINSYKQKESA